MSDDRRPVRGEHGRSTATLLPRLKRRGCNLLVSGPVSPMTTNQASVRLFGAPEIDRTRLVVRTDTETAVDDVLPGDLTAQSPDVHVVDAATYADHDAPLVALSEDISRAVDNFTSSAAHRIGGELRLCVTSVDALLDSYGLAATENFLRRTTGAVLTARGMGHYRLSGPRSASSIPAADIFDAFVDLREGTTCEHRISVPTVASTNWVAL